jgi:hypothetical protein
VAKKIHCEGILTNLKKESDIWPEKVICLSIEARNTPSGDIL